MVIDDKSQYERRQDYQEYITRTVLRIHDYTKQNTQIAAGRIYDAYIVDWKAFPFVWKGFHIVTCISGSRQGFWLDIAFTDHFNTQSIILRFSSGVTTEISRGLCIYRLPMRAHMPRASGDKMKWENTLNWTYPKLFIQNGDTDRSLGTQSPGVAVEWLTHTLHSGGYGVSPQMQVILTNVHGSLQFLHANSVLFCI
jgi:hypothetical protein